MIFVAKAESKAGGRKQIREVKTMATKKQEQEPTQQGEQRQSARQPDQQGSQATRVGGGRSNQITMRTAPQQARGRRIEIQGEEGNASQSQPRQDQAPMKAAGNR